MTLLTPLALLLSVLAVPIILLYVLKLRRPIQTVSSTILWQRTLEDVQANAPWQRLRPNVLLLLQLLVLAFLVLSLARPAYSRAVPYGGDLVVIVDQSFAMQAHDVSPSRFAAALARAHALAGGLAAGNVMSVIGMSAQPDLAIAKSEDQSDIGQAIDSLHSSASQPDFLRAFSLAASLARGQNTTLVVLTSRDSGIGALPFAVNFPVAIVRLGGRARDLAITGFQAQRSAHHIQALARVTNFGSRRARSDLDLFLDGQLADVRPIDVPPGQVHTLVWSNFPVTVRAMQVELTVHDDVDADKSAWAVVPQPAIHHVLLVSTPDYFLQTALLLDSGVRLTVVPPRLYRASLTQAFDLAVFNGYLPVTLPNVPSLMVNPPAGVSGPVRFGPNVKLGSASIKQAVPDPTGTLLSYVDLSDVHVASVRRVSFPDWLHPVAVSSNIPIIAAGESGQTRVVVFAFDLQQSDWPLRVSFPIAVQNLVRYLIPPPEVDTTSVMVGRPVRLSVKRQAREIDVTRPDGAVIRLRPPLPLFTDTSRPGLYSVAEIGTHTHIAEKFAVNYPGARAAPETGPQILLLGRQSEQHTRTVHTPISLAWLFGLLALSLLSAEWWFALRR